MGKLIKLLDSYTKDKIFNDLIESLTKASIPVGEHKHIFDNLKKLLKEASEFSKDLGKIKVEGRNGYLQRKGFDKMSFQSAGVLLESNQYKTFSGLFASVSQRFHKKKSVFMLLSNF